ncbi:MAG: site-2 protease family protein [Phycisphaeraceae bacterium]|nr:site-2 protease family protein [Phycisphaeraceae bacterium]
MSSLISFFTSLPDLVLVIIGFTLIIVVHELGHFLAARWAGVRVLAFAVGFGPSLVSFRKGLGIRRGSSEDEYLRLAERGEDSGISPTEYRFNALPFGGYVKMLGQDDANPAATSDAPDSFQNCVVWKRMVIISAGVVMNVILAAALFIVVFMIGLKVTPPMVGLVAPNSPAAMAVPVNGDSAGVSEPGLRAGDRILAINGEAPGKFEDLITATAMARRGSSVSLEIDRPGVQTPLRFEVVPRVDEGTRLQMIGVGPAMSARLPEARTPAARRQWETFREAIGVPELEPGMTLVRIEGREVTTAHDLSQSAAKSDGRPMRAVFRAADGREVETRLTPTPAMQTTAFRVEEGANWAIDHLLGLTPVLRVAATNERGEAAGLQRGDVFAMLGWMEWPSMADGVAAIRAARGKSIRAVVMRPRTGGGWDEVDLGEVPVSREGQVGFTPRDSAGVASWIAGWPTAPRSDGGSAPSGAMLNLLPGSRIVGVEGQPVTSLYELAAALGTFAASSPAAEEARVELLVELPRPAGAATGTEPLVERVAWTLHTDELRWLRGREWRSPISEADFVPAEGLLQAAGPLAAVGMGLRETHSVMLTTYLTFARLFQGTVKVTHLKGPVGIAHVGTLLAGRGIVWLLFFMALISVNLAVINFLPIPIADGGHMVFLIWEQATGRPVSPMVQNVAALAGLALLASVFVIVTFNDLRNLFTG